MYPVCISCCCLLYSLLFIRLKEGKDETKRRETRDERQRDERQETKGGIEE